LEGKGREGKGSWRGVKLANTTTICPPSEGCKKPLVLQWMRKIFLWSMYFIHNNTKQRYDTFSICFYQKSTLSESKRQSNPIRTNEWLENVGKIVYLTEYSGPACTQKY
jgi:hypothetical protein